jgi:predicted metal-binding protein
MLSREINAAIAITPLSEHVRVEGTGCMAGCSRPCTVAFCAPRKATYLFGDIGGGTDVEALVEFAKQYGNLLDGMSRSSERPAQLLGKTLARIPAAAPAERPRS